MPRDQWKEELHKGIWDALRATCRVHEVWEDCAACARRFIAISEVAEAAVKTARKRGQVAAGAQAGHRLVQENERLRRELEQARKGLT